MGNSIFQIEKYMADGREIIIYGTGKIGKLVLCWMDTQKKIHPKCFAITEVSTKSECLGIPVLSIAQVFEEWKSAVVVIATEIESFRMEMQEKWLSLGGKEEDCIFLLKEDLQKLTSEVPLLVRELIEMKRQQGVLNQKLSEVDAKLGELETKSNRLKPRPLLKFEVHLAEHCNLNCKGCFHMSSIAKPEFLDPEEYEKDCARLSELYDGDMEWILLLGGEPLLNPRVTEFFEITRKYFPVGRLSILTNGLLLPKMPEEFWLSAQKNSVEIQITHYPISLDYDAIRTKAERYGLVFEEFWMVADEQGNKLLENYHFDLTGKQSVEDNFARCYRANECITLRHGRLYTCVMSAHLHHLKEFFHLEQIHISNRNSIDIYEAKSAEEIAEFLTKPIPACRFCDLSKEKKYIPFQQTERKLEEWL